MREKVEREGEGKHHSPRVGGIRLTEYDERRSDGFIRRLDQEATSFFFTNLPDDCLAVDLWKIFAKYGRVGEVYLPNKMDKWGRRFGFVKFLEVKQVEELENKLGEVWCGSFKLRINLSRFAKSNNWKARVQPPKETGGVSSAEVFLGAGKSFKEVIRGKSVLSDKGFKEKGGAESGCEKRVSEGSFLSLPLHLEPDLEFLPILENSVVGRLLKGKNIKQVHFNLCMEGYRNVRVASMGEGWVLVFSESDGDVGLAMNNKSWWEGLLEDFRPWSPLMVTSKREVWVRIYGVPLQLWNEQVFRTILKPGGEVVGLDEETRSRSRFDIARVKLLTPTVENIDFSQELISQGHKFVVRVMEERGGPLEFVHLTREEDQFGWSAAFSSCDSGERVGQGMEEAMVVGGEFDESDSDGSQQCNQGKSAALQVVQRRQNVQSHSVVKSQNSFRNTEVQRSICSKEQTDKSKGGDTTSGALAEVETIRGLTNSNLGDCGRSGDAEIGVELVGQVGETSSFIPVDLCPNGPILLGLESLNREELVNALDGSGGSLGRVIPDLVGPLFGNNVVDKLDVLVSEARVKILEANRSFSQEDSNLSSSYTSSNQSNTEIPNRKGVVRQRKPLSRLPFPNMLGPKCLRLMSTVNGVGSSRRSKKSEGEGRSKKESNHLRQKGVAATEDVNTQSHEISLVPATEALHGASSSGVNLILGDDSLEDLEGYETNREGTEAARLEAERILEIQEDLGLSFAERKEVKKFMEL
ncbi:hypothetical protein TSUD_128460 [Trifolium subterraneum]|uniref:RRM domain-containing protein n=1 Tax=Trifolium subterraneum TaxID=3900 RepID=A0A2Z6MEA3_TRISU|nr:hypothetical protein TSUD_128460 [Trifolium subterraneum]